MKTRGKKKILACYSSTDKVCWPVSCIIVVCLGCLTGWPSCLLRAGDIPRWAGRAVRECECACECERGGDEMERETESGCRDSARGSLTQPALLSIGPHVVWLANTSGNHAAPNERTKRLLSLSLCMSVCSGAFRLQHYKTVLHFTAKFSSWPSALR